MIHGGAGANFRDDGGTAMRSPYTRRTTIAAGQAQARKVGAGDTANGMTVK
jgi:hypothetical protein